MHSNTFSSDEKEHLQELAKSDDQVAAALETVTKIKKIPPMERSPEEKKEKLAANDVLQKALQQATTV